MDLKGDTGQGEDEDVATERRERLRVSGERDEDSGDLRLREPPHAKGPLLHQGLGPSLPPPNTQLSEPSLNPRPCRANSSCVHRGRVSSLPPRP